MIQYSADEFVTEFHPLCEFFFSYDGVFYLATKEVFREEEIEIILVYITDDQDIDEIICRFTGHVLETTTHDEEREIVLATEIFIELAECVEAFTKYHLEIGEYVTVEIERIMFGVFFPTRFQDSEVFEVFEFTTDSVYLLIYITTELSDEEVLFWIKSMLQEEFFEEFFSTV